MNQLKAGIILSYVIIGITMVTGILFTPIKLRLLGPSEFGMYSLAAAVIGYLAVLDFGFSNAIVRYTAKYRAEGKIEEQYKLWGMFLKVYCFIGLIVFILGLILTFNVENIFSRSMSESELYSMKIIMLIMTFNLSINFPIAVFRGIITAYENFIWQKCLQISSMLLMTFSTLALLLIGYKAIALVVVTSLVNTLNFSFNIWYCFKKLKIKIIFGKIDIPLLKEVSAYSFWIFLNTIIFRFYWTTGQFALGIYNGTKAVAIYAVALQLKTIYLNFSGAISGVLLPKITAMSITTDSEKKLSNIFIKTGRLQFILIAFLTSGFILFGKAFVLFWAGKDYESSYPVTLVLFASVLINTIQGTGMIILNAKNKMKFRSLVTIVISIISVIFMIIISKDYGALGCAWVLFIAMLLGQGLIMNIYYAKVIKLDIIRFWKEILNMAIVPIFLALSFYCLTREFNLNITTIQDLIIYASLFTAIYLPLFWYFSMNTYEKNLFINIGKKLLRK